jgi:hypothetical protein
MQASVDIVRAAQWLEDADGLLLTSGLAWVLTQACLTSEASKRFRG